ncbi:hypothetical protein I302_101593 [Kwoniella bestiolae CBS 10118]|uniref:D-isomer specific 2-hydroxyacid dehydrogenase NAD-binding domain-containing protein n=1 Tax=Kwoniella bestiolae CBS 10118 TaxID=1296100 RepID=A0A1B9GCP8_9TREE|nr:hypothetical protein I302_00275 [Kwoniella bestiolae CBS 10118]OCF28786.1 hypothetical protein I302_00275 [Kwoniella bestiolae CBS 10118]
MSKLDFTVAVTVEIPPASVDELQRRFKKVHYHPDGNIDASAIPEIQLWLTPNSGLPASIPSIKDLPALKHIQLVSAGAEKALATQQMQAYATSPGNATLSTASGLHVLSIPNYVIAQMINICSQIPRQIAVGRSTKRWHSAQEVDESGGEVYYNRMTKGKTVGFLGYGALGRETARLLQSFGMKLIAANTSGKATPQATYIIPGTGDADGSIPSRYYSTKNSKSLEEFLKQSDVLVCSLPRTDATAYFLDSQKLSLLPKGAVFINVGRGNLISSEELQKALDVPGALLGAAIDVTDPEPLPDNHFLWSHPKLLITPHLSGDTENELGIAADIFLANAERIAAGKDVYNKVHFARGY